MKLMQLPCLSLKSKSLIVSKKTQQDLVKLFTFCRYTSACAKSWFDTVISQFKKTLTEKRDIHCLFNYTTVNGPNEIEIPSASPQIHQNKLIKNVTKFNVCKEFIHFEHGFCKTWTTSNEQTLIVLYSMGSNSLNRSPSTIVRGDTVIKSF